MLASAPVDEARAATPEHDEHDEHDERRAAREELLARLGSGDEPPPRASHRRGVPPTDAQLRDLARLDEQDRRRSIAAARARRAQKPRGGRVPTGTRPRARNAFLAALGALAAAFARAPNLQEQPPELAPTVPPPEPDTPRSPPSLHDVRARPGARTPRRRRHGPRWLT